MSITPAGFLALKNSSHRPAAGASRIGPSDPRETVSISLRLRQRQDTPALDLNAFSTTPHNERTVLTREEFALRHGAATADIERITAFAKQAGLKLIETSAPRRTVVVSGTVAQINKAFGVELTAYQTATHTYRSHEGDVHLPAALAEVVEAALGFDNRPLLRPHFRAHLAPQGATPANTVPLTPPQVAGLYNFGTASAAGQTIGILEFGGGYQATDIQAYFNNVVHLTPPRLTNVGVDGATNSPGQQADVEVLLDIDVAGSVAQGANIVVYFAPNTNQGIMDAFTTAIHDTTNRPSVLSVSWGGDEAGWGSSIPAISAVIQEAAAVGVTVLVSSGDSGSENPAAVEFFASDPWVTACGGTTTQNVSGSSYTQVVWGGSGGGISNSFALPYWQSWAGVPPSVNPAGHVGRGVPDIAGNADPASGYYLIQNGRQIGPIGGTSAVAPLYAGLVAKLNASIGEPLGYLNYNLYAFAGPEVYHDIVTGNNGLYQARAGWDACTGYGTVDGTGILNALWGVGLPPALENFNNQLYMAWKGIEGDDGIYYSAFNGSAWAAQQKVANVATSSGVALASCNGKLYMAWKGMQADQGIYWSTFDGSSWAPQQQVSGVGTSTGPRLGVLNGKLYMAWKGVEGDQRLFFSTFSGSAWAAQQQIANVASSVGPAIAAFGDQLVAVWKGEWGDQGIYYSTFNGSAWAPQRQIPAMATSEGPSIAVANGKLYAVWKGMWSDQRLWYSSFDGTNWAPQLQIPGVASSVGPGLVALGSKLLAAWKGMLGDERIWYSLFDGSSWSPQQIVSGVGTSPDL